MKKLISVALVFVMMFALAAVASAKDSPIAKDYFHVSIEIEGDGDAASDKDKVETTAVGEDGIVTLSANPESGNFTLWILDGDFDVVEGSEDSPVYKIRPHSDVHVTASFSQDKDNLTITAAASGDGKATADPEKVKKGSGNTVTLTAVDGKDTFSEWKLACKYDIVSGDLKSRKLVIKPYTDVHATPVRARRRRPRRLPKRRTPATPRRKPVIRCSSCSVLRHLRSAAVCWQQKS